MLVFEFGRGEVGALAFGPNGRQLFAPWGGGLWTWDDVTAGRDPDGNAYAGKYPEGPLRLSADGRRLSCRAAHGPLVYTVGGGEPLQIARSRPKGENYSNAALTASVTPDGNSVVVCENVSAFNGWGGHRTQITLRPLADPRLESAVWAVTTTNVTHDDPLVIGAEIVTAECAANREKERWELVLVARDLGTGKERRASVPIADGPRTPVASADGRFVVCLHGKKLVVWTSGAWDQPPRSIASDNSKHFTGIAFHPSGRFLGTTSNDKTVKLYDTVTWGVAHTFTWNIGKMRCIAFSPDGALAAAGSETGKIVV
jgi:WD40 repeat protein